MGDGQSPHRPDRPADRDGPLPPGPAVGYDVLRAQLATRPTGRLPRQPLAAAHVVFDINAIAGGIEVFDPAYDRFKTVKEERWTRHRIRVAGWAHFWVRRLPLGDEEVEFLSVGSGC